MSFLVTGLAYESKKVVLIGLRVVLSKITLAFTRQPQNQDKLTNTYK